MINQLQTPEREIRMIVAMISHGHNYIKICLHVVYIAQLPMRKGQCVITKFQDV